jgi:hypothetical protein
MRVVDAAESADSVIEQKKQERKEALQDSVLPEPKYLWLSVSLSAIYPGLGQFYNGHVGKGIGMAALATFGIYSLVRAANITQETRERCAGEPPGECFDSRSGTLWLGGGFFTVLAWTWSIADAAHYTRRINRKNGYNSDGTRLVLAPDIRLPTAKTNAAYGMRLGISF